VFGISGVDNLLRPYLISRGTQQPFALTLLGVMGGVLAFGFIGFFIGPTLLAVGYSLLNDWSTHSRDRQVSVAAQGLAAAAPWADAADGSGPASAAPPLHPEADAGSGPV
jgi:hypothetical protein